MALEMGTESATERHSYIAKSKPAATLRTRDVFTVITTSACTATADTQRMPLLPSLLPEAPVNRLGLLLFVPAYRRLCSRVAIQATSPATCPLRCCLIHRRRCDRGSATMLLAISCINTRFENCRWVTCRRKMCSWRLDLKQQSRHCQLEGKVFGKNID